MTTDLLYRRRWLLIRLPIALVAMALAVCAWLWLYPMPPTQLTISAGQIDGAYQRYAERYVDAFARHGVDLAVQASSGSKENLQRLQSVPAKADLAFVQGGFGWSSAVGEKRDVNHVQTLAVVDIEALWLFGHEESLTSLVQLMGKRVAAGPEGSGHRAMLLRLLEQQRIDPSTLRWSDLSGTAARDALLRGEVDAVFMVASPTAAGVLSLLGESPVKLAALARPTAIAERNNYLESRLLIQDALGPGQPPHDASLLTTPTHLVARDDLDPALKRIATAVAMEVHSQAGPFHRAGEFPSLRFSDFPSAPEARQVLTKGPSRLENNLPFWWAQLLQRLVIIGLPLTLLCGLLFLVIPAWVRWRLESRVTRWYGELKFIENDLRTNSVDMGGIDLSRINSRLRKMDEDLDTMQLPRELADRWYALRQHVTFVRESIRGYRGR
ncbi:MAG TPA: TAXI family TRAP transporter solute-binding subunit [Hydrogenophaga sp.]